MVSMSDRALHRDIAMNLLEPTSIGVQLGFYPLFCHIPRSSSYLNFFRSWVTSSRSSHGTVNSHIIIFFILFENINISGRIDVVIWSVNFNFVSKSALNSQSVASDCVFGVGFFMVWILLQPWQVFVAASHQTRLDTRSKARRPIKVGIKGRGRSGTSRDSKSYQAFLIIWCICTDSRTDYLHNFF